ncbi:MAG: hypothetical protein ACRD29_25515 [Acidimicrobiales bacterium]
MSGGYQTRPFCALGFSFAVNVVDPAFGRYLDNVFAPLATAGAPEHVYTVVRQEGPDQFLVAMDGDSLDTFPRPASTLSFLMWHINRQAIEQSTDLVLIHAGAAAHGDDAVVLPAPAGSGKTTLVTALVRAGMQYVTDEAVAIDAPTGMIVPYPKPLSIDAGSWPLFPDLAPEPDPAVRPYLSGQWHVPVGAIREGAVAGSSRPRLIVVPSFDPTTSTTLSALSRGRAVGALVECSFNVGASGRERLELLADVVRRCDCYELVVHDLAEATRGVERLLGVMAPSVPAG